MKKIFVLIIVITSLTSCTKEEFFSCDPDADSWVKSNLSEIREMKRKEWLEIGNIDYQRAAYRSYTAEQKQTLWIDKISEVLVDVVWTQQEREHIKALLAIVTENQEVFESEVNQEDMDNIEIDLYRWREYANEELNWSPELLYALINTPEAMTADKQIAASESSVIRLKSGTESGSSSCNCNASSPTESSSSGNWACNYVFYQCNTSSGCAGTSSGCGNIWLYSCNGTCVSR